jgi:hypothetical protein
MQSQPPGYCRFSTSKSVPWTSDWLAIANTNRQAKSHAPGKFSSATNVVSISQLSVRCNSCQSAYRAIKRFSGPNCAFWS